jgi:nicotinamidase-related amidase
MPTRFSFFDIDCLETSPDGIFHLRPRVKPMRDRLNLLYSRIRESGYPMVFTTCCSGSLLRPEWRKDILFVPLDRHQTEWKSGLETHRLIYLEKRTYGDPKKNTLCRAFDMFYDNGNAAALVRELAADEWILFGNGVECCINAAVNGVLQAGGHVTILSDCLCSNDGVDAPAGMESARDATLNRWLKMGVTPQTMEECLKRIQMEAVA